MHVKRGDTVKITTGSADVKNKTGRVLAVSPENNTVTVENLNLAIRHKKPKKAQEAGGRTTMPAPVHASNVVVICQSCNSGTRINYKTSEENGKKIKVRVCKKCGAALDKKVESVKARKERREKEKAAKKEKKEKKAKEKGEASDGAGPSAEKPAKKQKPAKVKDGEGNE